MSGRAFVGVSGWSYRAWRGDFYPSGLAQRAELGYVADRVTSVEVNGSFYSLQRPTTWEHWATQVPDGFPLAVKGSRFITHLKRLRDVRTPMANFLASGVPALGDRLGPLLWQLPARAAYDPGLLGDFLALLPRSVHEAMVLAREHDGRLREDRVWPGIFEDLEDQEDRPLRHALEPRHTSFGSDAARQQLAEAGVPLVVADTAGHWPELGTGEGPFVYVRLHGEQELYTSRYSDDALDAWAERVRGWTARGLDVHAYFDNDARGHAPHDAVRLLGRLEGAGPR